MAAGCCGCLRPRVDAVVHYSTQARPLCHDVWRSQGVYARYSGDVKCAHAKMRGGEVHLSAVLTEMWADRSTAHVVSQSLALLHALGCMRHSWSADSG